MTTTTAQELTPLEQLRLHRNVSRQSVITKRPTGDQRILAAILDDEPFDYMDDPAFVEPDAEKAIFDPAHDLPQPNTSWYHPVMDSIADPRSAKGVVNVVLTKEQERVLFLQYNYARYRIEQLRRASEGETLTNALADEIMDWYRTARDLRDRISQFNLALVLAMAKRVRNSDLDFGDLISEGNMALLRAVDKFNVSKGFKLSTYACRAILKAFSRTGIKQTQYKSMFPTDFDPAMEKSDHTERRYRAHEEDCADEVKRIVLDNDAELTDVEQQVIEHRFALSRTSQPDVGPMTLEQVGKLVGLTKERVRQIQNKALVKIRKTLEDQYLDGPHAVEHA